MKNNHKMTSTTPVPEGSAKSTSSRMSSARDRPMTASQLKVKVELEKGKPVSDYSLTRFLI